MSESKLKVQVLEGADNKLDLARVRRCLKKRIYYCQILPKRFCYGNPKIYGTQFKQLKLHMKTKKIFVFLVLSFYHKKKMVMVKRHIMLLTGNKGYLRFF